MQGQGIATEEKSRGFASIFTQQAKACRSILSRVKSDGRMFHFELHGGSGWNDQVGVVGSPVLASHIFQEIGVPHIVVAAERDEGCAAKLAERVSKFANAYVVTGDNRELVTEVPRIISHFGENPRFALGTIVIDPNGGNPSDIPWQQLTHICSICPRLDVVINWPATAMKRERSHYIDLDRIPSLLSKRFWLIRSPISAWQFTMIVGRNMRFREHAALGFYDWNSPTGRESRLTARLTKAERAELCSQHNRQMELWDGNLQGLS